MAPLCAFARMSLLNQSVVLAKAQRRKDAKVAKGRSLLCRKLQIHLFYYLVKIGSAIKWLRRSSCVVFTYSIVLSRLALKALIVSSRDLKRLVGLSISGA